jgi:hypothetical protein
MCTNASEERSVSKIAFYQIFTAVKASILYFKSKCISEPIHTWEWYCMLCFLIQSISLIFFLCMVAIIRALLHTELEFTVHFSPEIHLILFQTSVKVLTPSFWAALATSEHIYQQKVEPDEALVLKN